MAEVVSYVEDLGMGGGICQDIRNLLQGRIEFIDIIGLEMCVMTPQICLTLGSLYHSMDLHIAGIKPRRNAEERWEYPPLTKMMLAKGLDKLDSYILFHQITLDRYIATHLILELFSGCGEATNSTGGQDMFGEGII